MRSSVYLVALGSEISFIAEQSAKTEDAGLVLVSSTDAFFEHHHREAAGCVIVDATPDPDANLNFLSQMVLRGNVQIPVILLLKDPAISFVVDAMRKGAASVVPLGHVADELPREIARTIALDAVRAPSRREIFEAQDRLAKLTNEELKILALILEGSTNKDIATMLDMGLRTVEKRRNSIAGKLAADSVPAMVRLSMASGMSTSRFTPLANRVPRSRDRDDDSTADRHSVSFTPR
jgi:two-component system response regulator FixJ